jgi:hypothetical protein
LRELKVPRASEDLAAAVADQRTAVIVQNGVERKRLGTAMATTNFFRALGGRSERRPGAVFAAQDGLSCGVRLVFAIAAPLGAVGSGACRRRSWRKARCRSRRARREPPSGRCPPEERPASPPARAAIGAAR